MPESWDEKGDDREMRMMENQLRELRIKNDGKPAERDGKGDNMEMRVEVNDNLETIMIENLLR